jgi:zinc transporter, ZIP family
VSPVEAGLLGLIAGSTIFLGLPVGRLRTPMLEGKALLNGIATGVLIFLLWDVLSHAWAPIDISISVKHYASATGNGLVLIVGLGLGLLGLVYYDRWMARRATRAPQTLSVGPGAAAVTELRPRPLLGTQPRRLALFIAIGIGLHNFAEGLAIGQSAAHHEIALATVLVIGFALHNATEGFGIVAPLAAESERPSWRTLALLGVIGGGPTFVGTIIGRSFVSNLLSIGFLALAAGSILYVVIELLAVGRRLGMKVLLTWGLVIGVTLGFVTDAIVSAAGG